MFDELGIGQILCMSSWITTVAAAVSILTGHFLSTSSGKLDPYFNQKLYQVSSKEYLQSEVLCIPILLLVNILPLVLLHQVLYAVYILCSKSQRYGGNNESNFASNIFQSSSRLPRCTQCNIPVTSIEEPCNHQQRDKNYTPEVSKSIFIRMLSLFKLVGSHQTSPSHHITTPIDNIITVSNFLHPQNQTVATTTHSVSTPNHNLTQTNHIAVSPGLDRPSSSRPTTSRGLLSPDIQNPKRIPIPTLQYVKENFKESDVQSMQIVDEQNGSTLHCSLGHKNRVESPARALEFQGKIFDLIFTKKSGKHLMNKSSKNNRVFHNKVRDINEEGRDRNHRAKDRILRTLKVDEEMMDSINGLNEMNMDELAMDEYLRSLDEKRDDEYSFIFNAHLRSAEEEFNRIERAPSASRTGFNQYPEPASDLSSMSDFEAYFKPNRKESIIPDQNKLEQHRMAQIAGRFLYMHPVFFGVSSIPLYVLAVIYLTYSSPDYPGSISSSNSSSTYSSSSLSSTVPLMLIQVWSIWDPIMYSVLSILTRFMFQGSVYKLYL